MSESRFSRLGRYEAHLVYAFILQISETERANYVVAFFQEVKRYSDVPRRKGEPKNVGCVWELNDLDDFDLMNPGHLAKLVKEIWHTKYQKQNAKRERTAFLTELSHLLK